MESFDVEGVQGRESGNSLLGQLVLQWLREDLAERGPRNGMPSEGKTYDTFEGKGGYGAEKAPPKDS